VSHEGVTLVARAALAACLIVAAAVFRALLGPGKNRGRIMLAGTLGGMAFGVLVGYLISPVVKTDESAIWAVLGVPLGWGATWLLARQPPREAS
jgi:hypothetical protein